MVLKALILVAAAVLMVGLPAALAIMLVNFLNDKTVTNKVEWKAHETMSYPNITVCNAKFFDKRLLDREFSLEEVNKYEFFFFLKQKLFFSNSNCLL